MSDEEERKRAGVRKRATLAFSIVGENFLVG